MATREQVIELMTKFRNVKPTLTCNKLNHYEMGMKLVLLYLSEHSDAYALTIGKELNISRERIRVLLNKLEQKDFIEKTTSLKDARIELVRLTPQGMAFIEKDKEEKLQLFTDIVNKIGYEKISDFIDTMALIKKMLPECN